MNYNDNQRDTFLDQLLDASLARYAQVEPRPGLEERLLAGVRAEPSRPLWWRWAWLPATAGAVALIVVGALVLSERREPTPPASRVARTAEAPTAVAPSPAVKETVPGAPAKTTPRATRPTPASLAALPRRQEFPSPSPLSEQEQLLLRYVQQTPKEEVLTAAARDPLQPLAIEPLVIPPLPAGPNGSQEIPN